MTNYNDGKWHGWNGGECPVDPKTTVVIKWSCNGVETIEATAYSHSLYWEGDGICAFRVIKEHREPREWYGWMHASGRSVFFDTEEKRAAHVFTYGGEDTCFTVREVLE